MYSTGSITVSFWYVQKQCSSKWKEKWVIILGGWGQCLPSQNTAPNGHNNAHKNNKKCIYFINYNSKQRSWNLLSFKQDRVTSFIRISTILPTVTSAFAGVSRGTEAQFWGLHQSRSVCCDYGEIILDEDSHQFHNKLLSFLFLSFKAIWRNLCS